MTSSLKATLVLSLALAPCASFAILRCDIAGESVNPANGHTTQGKTGLMQCRDADTGLLQREEELRNGAFVGLRRFYERGVLARESTVNERGNADGVLREFEPTGLAPGARPPLVRESIQRNGTTVGLARAWYPEGGLRRVSFHGDDGRELAVAELTPSGQLQQLRCGDRPLLAPPVDDAAWCGHGDRGASAVSLFDTRGRLVAKSSYVRGERRRHETLSDAGKPLVQEVVQDNGGSERRFNAEGVLLKELEWTGPRRERRMTIEREFHASGTQLRERHYDPASRFVEIVSDQQWYLNGQPKARTERIADAVQRETRYHDNGKVVFEGEWTIDPRGRQTARGTHRSFDEQGRLRGETFHDAKGVVVRERQRDEAGKVTRDDEVFEDGSRKGLAR